jgi:hypothetical protein
MMGQFYLEAASECKAKKSFLQLGMVSPELKKSFLQLGMVSPGLAGPGLAGQLLCQG